jgi:hypothetical protein
MLDLSNGSQNSSDFFKFKSVVWGGIPDALMLFRNSVEPGNEEEIASLNQSEFLFRGLKIHSETMYTLLVKLKSSSWRVMFGRARASAYFI